MTSPTLLLLAAVGSGRIQGGWGYVWTCYAITWSMFVLYGLSLYLRRPGRHEEGAP